MSAVAVPVSKSLRFLPGVGDAPGERPATYVEYLRSIGLAERTIDQYRRNVRQADERCLAMGVDLATANANALGTLAATFPNSHPVRGQLRCALKHWYEWQDRMDAPLRAVRVPQNPRMVCKALEPEQARKLEETARGWWPQGGATLLGLYLALRREEIAKAEWGRFSDDMTWYTVQGKFSKTATIPVHPVVIEELAPRRGKGYIFPGRKGYGLFVDPSTIWKWTRDVATAAGIDGWFSTHVLRHTSLTTALEATDNLRAVMAFARHNKPDVTAGYTRTTNEQLRRVSDALRF